MIKIPQLNSCCCICSLRTGSIWIAIWGIILSGFMFYGANIEWERVKHWQPREDLSLDELARRERKIVYLNILLSILSLVSTVRISLSLSLLFGIFFHMPMLVLYWIVFSTVHMVYGVMLAVVGVFINSEYILWNLVHYPFYLYACLVVYSYYRMEGPNPRGTIDL